MWDPLPDHWISCLFIELLSSAGILFILIYWFNALQKIAVKVVPGSSNSHASGSLMEQTAQQFPGFCLYTNDGLITWLTVFLFHYIRVDLQIFMMQIFMVHTTKFKYVCVGIFNMTAHNCSDPLLVYLTLKFCCFWNKVVISYKLMGTVVFYEV